MKSEVHAKESALVSDAENMDIKIKKIKSSQKVMSSNSNHSKGNSKDVLIISPKNIKLNIEKAKENLDFYNQKSLDSAKLSLDPTNQNYTEKNGIFFDDKGNEVIPDVNDTRLVINAKSK